MLSVSDLMTPFRAPTSNVTSTGAVGSFQREATRRWGFNSHLND